MKLIGNTVLLEKLPQRKSSAGGITLPQQYQDDEKQWRVVAVGPGRTVRKKGKPDVVIPIEVEPGDYVLAEVGFANKAALENGQLIVDADQVLMKWTPGRRL